MCASNVAARSLIVVPSWSGSALGLAVAQRGHGAQPEVDDAAGLREPAAVEPAAQAAAGARRGEGEERVSDRCDDVEDQPEDQRLQPDWADRRIDELGQEGEQEQGELGVQRSHEHAVRIKPASGPLAREARLRTIAGGGEGADPEEDQIRRTQVLDDAERLS